MEGFNFKAPQYVPIFNQRVQALVRIRQNPKVLPKLFEFYREQPWQFIEDWGITFDPRNVERNIPAVVPFLLFPKQIDWCKWVIDHWRSRTPGLAEKTRDMGLSWLAMALSCSMCLFYDGFVAGFGSRKEEYVDKLDSPKSLFYKARMFMNGLPPEFRRGWDPRKNAPHLRLTFPHTRSYITGEAGDNIGRGDRTSIYFVDEAAFLERPTLIDASLSQTTNCRIDISSANGLGNPFAQKRHEGRIDVFTFHWRDDPRKDDAWYAKQVEELDPVTVAQEIDINYSASVEGVLIPSAWVQSAIDAHLKLDFKPSGAITSSLDVADEGRDKNAYISAQGSVVKTLEEWSGVGADIFQTVVQSFELCEQDSSTMLRYDADGLGAGVRGDSRVLNEKRLANHMLALEVQPFRGSGAVARPDSQDVKGRKNSDYFANMKAQAWWALRRRFQATHRAVVEGKQVSYDDVISIPSGLRLRSRLMMELSQPTYALNTAGKIVINKTPEGTKSPNLGDAVMIQFSGVKKALRIADELLAEA